jgi:hypothetical protein
MKMEDAAAYEAEKLDGSGHTLASSDRDRAEKMAAYRMHAQELGGGLAGIGYIGPSLESQNRNRALQIAWDLYRDKGDHELVLTAARQILDFLTADDPNAA